MRCPGRGPDRFEVEKISIDESLERIGVSDGRHTSDGEAGRGSNELGIGNGNVGLQVLRHGLFIYAVGATRDDEQGPTGVRTAKYQGFGYLLDPAAYGGGGLLGGAGGLRQLHHSCGDAGGGESSANAFRRC